MKIKPRNYIVLALIKRNGSGKHEKTNKSLRKKSKQELIKIIKESP